MENICGIIIRSTDYKDRDKILNLATPHGVVAVVARGVRSPSAKLKAFVNLLTFGDFCVKKSKFGNILTSIDSKENFFNCWSDTDKYASALLCLELFEKCFGSDDDTKHAFVLLLKVLKEINYSQVVPCAVALWFVVQVSKLMGIDFRQIIEVDKKLVCSLETMEKLDCSEIDSLEMHQNDIIKALKYFYLLFENDYGIKLLMINNIINSFNINRHQNA